MKSKSTTEAYLLSIPLPEETNSYTVIPHGLVIETIREMLTKNGFEIESEMFKAEFNGQVALGFMKIKNTSDPDMGMTFNWGNSYNKMLKFSCGIGGLIYDNQMPFIASTTDIKYARKHTGDALAQAVDVVTSMIESANSYFERIVEMKNLFKSTELNQKEYAKLSGLLYFDKELFSSEQASILKKERKNPSVDYTDKGTLWEFYKQLMFAVTDTSPRQWYKSQSELNSYIYLMYQRVDEDDNTEQVTRTPDPLGIGNPAESTEEIETFDDAFALEEEVSVTEETIAEEEPVSNFEAAIANAAEEQQEEVVEDAFEIPVTKPVVAETKTVEAPATEEDSEVIDYFAAFSDKTEKEKPVVESTTEETLEELEEELETIEDFELDLEIVDETLDETIEETTVEEPVAEIVETKEVVPEVKEENFDDAFSLDEEEETPSMFDTEEDEDEPMIDQAKDTLETYYPSDRKIEKVEAISETQSVVILNTDELFSLDD